MMNGNRVTGTKFTFFFFVCLIVMISLFVPGCGEKAEKAPPVKTASNDPGPTPKAPVPPPPARSDAYIAHITDIHFNPFYDITLVPELIKTDVNEWETVFLKSKIRELGIPGKDETNYPLLASTLESMSKSVNNPDCIVFTGDFLAHEFETRFSPWAEKGAKLEPFIDKTVAFVAAMIKKYFPGVPVFLSLGNNDCYSGDYQIIPGGKFLANSSEYLSELFLYSSDNRQQFCSTYKTGGYFELVPDFNAGARVISLNTILFSPKHKNTLDYDPAEKELDWLEKQLEASEKENRKVWLLLHIPPGTNIYSTVHKKEYIPMWKDTYNERFIQLSRMYAETVTADFCGHTHMDDFRVLLDEPESGKKQVYGFIRIGPAVSPQFGNNPGYQVLSYNRQAFRLGNDILHYIGLSPETPGPAWGKEYDFKEAYGHDTMTSLSMMAIYETLAVDEAVREKYIRFFNVSNTASPAITPATWLGYWCGIAQWTQAAYENCSSGKQ